MKTLFILLFNWIKGPEILLGGNIFGVENKERVNINSSLYMSREDTYV